MQQGEELSGKLSEGTGFWHQVVEEAGESVASRQIGRRLYELKDHLGNVRVVIGDYKETKELKVAGGNLQLSLGVKLSSYSQQFAFGMTMPGLNWQQGNYRYGFNGKEKDGEFANNYDYGFRIYNANIAKFLSVDPLMKDYPWYTPYQFAGNSPIKFVDLDGLEPAAADIENKEFVNRRGAIDAPYKATGGDNKFFKFPGMSKIGRFAEPLHTAKFFPMNTSDPLNRYVNQTSQFLVENENIFKTDNDLINYMLGNFAYGTGPENYVFPHNGKFSKEMAGSIAVGESLVKWAKNNYNDGIYSWGMDLRGEINVDLKSGLMSLEHFIGSASVRIRKVSDGDILVEVFNITSFTSGDLAKDIPGAKKFIDPVKSVVRRLDTSPHYSNISQYFSFGMSISEADKLVDKYSSGTVKRK